MVNLLLIKFINYLCNSKIIIIILLKTPPNIIKFLQFKCNLNTIFFWGSIDGKVRCFGLSERVTESAGP